METFSVYILYSQSADKYYIGYTNDISRRVEEHNDPSACSTKFAIKNGPWSLVYNESGFTSRSDAMKREKEIKGWKSRKMIQRLIVSKSSVGIPM